MVYRLFWDWHRRFIRFDGRFACLCRLAAGGLSWGGGRNACRNAGSVFGSALSGRALASHEDETPSLGFAPAFRKPVALGYILAYGTHTYELFAFRTWSFALLVFLASRADGGMGIGAVTTIVSLITVTGMLASLLGARLCLAFGRHRVIALIGGATALVSVIVAFSLDGPVWIAVAGLWIYNGFIMLDSGALTTGTVEAGDAYDRGALLAVHSMIGFGGGALGGPVVGYVLDQAGGASMMGAWFYALLAMGAGSAIVFAVQRHFWRRIG